MPQAAYRAEGRIEARGRRRGAYPLGLDADWLYYLAGRFPEDVRRKRLSAQEVTRAMTAFRKGFSARRGRR